MTLPNVPETPTQVLGTSGARVLPRVNLLPPEIHEAARFRRFQLAMAGAGVAAIAVVAVLGYSAHHSVTSAKATLADAQQQQTSLQNQLNSLQSVHDIYSQVSAKKAMLATAMAPEVRWSYYLTDLSLKVPANVWLTNVTANETGPSAPTTTAATTSVVPAGIGTVAFGGTAFSHDDVATWLDVLAKERGFVNAYFSNSAQGLIGTRKVVNFNSSVTLSQAALSGRYPAEG